MIKDLKSGTFINNLNLAVINVESKTTRQGKTYKDILLSDQSGQIRGKIWSEFVSECFLEQGRVVSVSGRVGEYQGTIEIHIEKSLLVDEDINSYQNQTPALVFDIETVGQKYSELGDWEQNYLINHLERHNPDKDDAKNKTGLYALFGFVCSIAAYDTVKKEGTLLHLSDTKLTNPDHFKVVTCKDEKTLLEEFWKLAKNYETFITFNGIDFDIPFLALRSAHNRVKIPGKMISLDRNQHIDLAQRFKQGMKGFKLEALTRFLGLSNPKEKGVSGLHVANLYRKGEHQAIVDYVSRDVLSTLELYNLYRQIFN